MPSYLGIVILSTLLLLASAAQVVELTGENFDFTERGAWLIKFYAPWCQHCKKLAPIWDELAYHYSKNNNNIKIAKVDCEAHSGVCSGANVEGYPTIKYYVDGLQKNYVGGRKKHDFINFVHKMSKPASSELTQEIGSKAFKQENPAFIYVSGAIPNITLKTTFILVAKHLQELSSPDFYELNDRSIGAEQLKDITEPSVVVFREGERTVYSGAAELEPLMAWAKENRFPYVSKYSEATYEALTNSQKLLVLGVTDTINAEQEKFNTDFKTVAKQRGKDPRFLFAALDALQYDRYATSFGAVPDILPTVVVLDQDNEIHFINETLRYSSPKIIEQFLKDVEDGKIPSQTWSYYAYYMKKVAKYSLSLREWVAANLLLFIASVVLFNVAVFYLCCTGSSKGKRD